MCKRLHIAIALMTAAALDGCGGALPRSNVETVSPWKNFQEAKTAFDEIVPHRTLRKTLHKLGFDPTHTPNTRILNYLDIQTMFMPNDSVSIAHLAPDIRTCLKQPEDCNGHEIKPQNLSSHREGNLLLDMFGFKRRTIETGWNFRALVVLQRDLVIYKLWGGVPRIHSIRDEKKPFGPLQDVRRSIARQDRPLTLTKPTF